MNHAKAPIWLDKRDAIALHEELLIRHGGSSGIRDDGLLESALARPLQHFAYSESVDIIHIAGEYIAGIVGNPPFVDGNKRTGFVAGVLFLELNGYEFTASEAEAAQVVLELAAGTVDETGLAAFLRDHVKPMKTITRERRR